MRCLLGSGGRRRFSALGSWGAAVVLAVPHLALPAAPAVDEASRDIDHWEAEFPSASWKNGDGLWTSRLHPRDSRVAFGGLHIGLWRSREEGRPAGAANVDGGRWRHWTGDSFARVADGASTRTGSQEMSDSSLLLGSWLLFTAGDSETSGGHGPGWGHAAPVRLTHTHSGSGKGLVCPAGVGCERARLLAGAAPSKGIGASGFSVSGRYGLSVSLNDVHPHVRVTLTKRLSVWWTYRF